MAQPVEAGGSDAIEDADDAELANMYRIYNIKQHKAQEAELQRGGSARETRQSPFGQ